MAVCNPWDKASLQHMAHLQQEASVHPAVLVHQHQTHLDPTLDHQNQQLARRQNLLTQIQIPYSTVDKIWPQ
jgi:hypothetical protein